MSREIGDRRGEARALFNAGEALRQQGEIARSRATYEESLTIRRAISDPAGIATLAVWPGSDCGRRRRPRDRQEVAQRSARDGHQAQSPAADGVFASRCSATLPCWKTTSPPRGRRHQEALDIRVALGEQGTAAESRAALAWLRSRGGKDGGGRIAGARGGDGVCGTEGAGQRGDGTRDARAARCSRRESAIVAAREIAQRTGARQAAACDVSGAGGDCGCTVRAAREPDAALKSLEEIRAESVASRHSPIRVRGAARDGRDRERNDRRPPARRCSPTSGRDAKAKGFAFYAR